MVSKTAEICRHTHTCIMSMPTNFHQYWKPFGHPNDEVRNFFLVADSLTGENLYIYKPFYTKDRLLLKICGLFFKTSKIEDLNQNYDRSILVHDPSKKLDELGKKKFTVKL